MLPKIKPYEGHKKIRIGYFSPDFYTHPVATGVADLFKYHDGSKFEVHAFSFGPDIKDSWNARVREQFRLVYTILIIRSFQLIYVRSYF